MARGSEAYLGAGSWRGLHLDGLQLLLHAHQLLAQRLVLLLCAPIGVLRQLDLLSNLLCNRCVESDSYMKSKR